jgi:hypothetical protein
MVGITGFEVRVSDEVYTAYEADMRPLVMDGGNDYLTYDYYCEKECIVNMAEKSAARMITHEESQNQTRIAKKKAVTIVVERSYNGVCLLKDAMFSLVKTKIEDNL